MNGSSSIMAVGDNKKSLELLEAALVSFGYRVAEELKREERTRNIPIIMLTALDDAYDRIKALQAGAEDFLMKPVHRKELAVRIHTLLKMKAYNDHLRNSRENLKNALTEKKAEIHEALESFSRFVPREFLQCLGKTNSIDVSLGDAITALFPESEESALAAAVEMLRYLEIYNAQRQHMYYTGSR